MATPSRGPREDGMIPTDPASGDAIRSAIAAYAAATTEEAQSAAIQRIAVMLHDSTDIRVSSRDADSLVTLCSQRLRVVFQNDLERFNLTRLEGGHAMETCGRLEVTSPASSADTLAVLQQVLRDEDRNHIAVLVRERLPSTLVKVVKACCCCDAPPSNPDLLLSIMNLLQRLARSREVICELMESTTLHRLFYLSQFPPSMHLSILLVIDAIGENLPDDLWASMTAYLREHHSLTELIRGVDVAEDEMESIIRTTTLVLLNAYQHEEFGLYQQLRTEQCYQILSDAFSRTMTKKLSTCRDEPCNIVDRTELQIQRLVLVIGSLCLSGNDNAAALADMSRQDCFALFDASTPHSSLNPEGFGLLCQCLDALHSQTHSEQTGDQSDAATELATAIKEQAERQLIETIGHLIEQNRSDYVLIEQTGVLSRLLRDLDTFPDVTKLTIGSVLSAITIESGIIPYAELACIPQVISRADISSCSASVLLGLVVNLLRYNEVFQRVFVANGSISAVIALMKRQALVQCRKAVASTKINVEYPTSAMRFTDEEEGSGEDVAATDDIPLAFLTSHCRQTCVVRRIDQQTALDRRSFILALEALTVFSDATQAGTQLGEGKRDELFELEFLECLCMLLADAKWQDEAMQLWTSILGNSVKMNKSSPSLHNVVNCLLQSMRYVALALHYSTDAGVTFAFEGSVNVLNQCLVCVQETIRPTIGVKSSGVQSPSVEGKSQPVYADQIESSDRRQLIVAFNDCGGGMTCLCALYSLTRSQATGDENEAASAAVLAMRILLSLLHGNQHASDAFLQTVTFGYYGALIHKLLEKKLATQEINIADVANQCFRLVAALAIDDYALADGIGDIDKYRVDLKHPEALISLIQLVGNWGDHLRAEDTVALMRLMTRIVNIQGNAKALAFSNGCQVIFRAFASMNSSSALTAGSVRMALLELDNPYHQYAMDMLLSTIRFKIPHEDAVRWIKLIIHSMSTRYIQSKSQSIQHPVSPLLSALSRATSDAQLHGNSNPVIVFDVSKEGFAYMQIPDIQARATTSASSISSPPGPSLASISQIPKAWPPADGYSVAMWFRVDHLETRDEREKEYWDLLMSNICVMCRGPIRDDSALKCSHRACRGCHEALMNCGGECVICNPPKFYIFRLRSGDGKSFTELFIKGSKLHMRTSASKTPQLFVNATIQTGQWYHIAVVHMKQRFQSSHVALYVNGIISETVKMSYPAATTAGQPLSGSVGIPSQSRRVSICRWMLGSLLLLDDAASAHLINCIYCAGPGYDGLFFGASGVGDVPVALTSLRIENLLLLDEYMKDPIRALIESVDSEKVNRSSFLRGSLSLASAASSAAAAIVQDMKLNGNIFGRIPSAAPFVNIPIQYDRIALLYSARNAVESGLPMITNSRADGRPFAQLIGGAMALSTIGIGETLHGLCGSSARIVYLFLEQVRSESELECALELLWNVTRGNAWNLQEMELEHGYIIVNHLLHQKVALLGTKALSLLFRMVGNAVDIDSDRPTVGALPEGDLVISNLFAMQFFVLDYSLWKKADTGTQRLLFTSLYSSLVTGQESLRERNLAQLQSLFIVRQLLYVFIDRDVDPELLRVITDLVLVCLSGSGRESVLNRNFADVAAFLASTLSPRFLYADRSFAAECGPNDRNSDARRPCGTNDLADLQVSQDKCIASLGLSPRSRSPSDSKSLRRFQYDWSGTEFGLPTGSDAAARRHRSRVQDLLLDILAKAVQKRDLKEVRERDDSSEAHADIEGVSVGSTNAPLSGPQRMQLSLSSKLTGIRKVLSPRWISAFFVSSTRRSLAPTTIVFALKLLTALLSRPRYESVFRKDGYYRLLTQGLPCDHRDIASVSDHPSGTTESISFPFHEMWYTLFCIMLGTPVDGIPHDIQFEMFFICKDFELNIKSDAMQNPNVVWVILAIMRRHFDDFVAFDKLRKIRTRRELSVMREITPVLDSTGDQLRHIQVLEFLQHVYVHMPSFQKLIIGGGDKSRVEILEELALLATAAARAQVLIKYAPDEPAVRQELLRQKKESSTHEFATCHVQLAEEAAINDDKGSDPFLNPVTIEAVKWIVSILLDAVTHLPSCVETLEMFFDGDMGSALVPPLHPSFSIRFQTLVMTNLLDELRVKVADDVVLTESKQFPSNLQDFLRFAVKRMQVWQRAQHGDGRPHPMLCFSPFHFAGGPMTLLDLTLFVLGETTVGVPSTGAGTPSPASSLVGMLNEKLSKGKKRRQLRQMLSRMNFSRSVELEGLTASIYGAMNTVILHVIHGRGNEVSDEDIEALLRRLHEHRDIVLAPRNNDKAFLACVGRLLLQLLTDSKASLQQIAAHVWIDMMAFQHAAIAEMLMIEIRRSGAPYTINLLKNGFDALLKCAEESPSAPANAPSFRKFVEWIEVVGPPLKELEMTLDRIYLKNAVEVRDNVHEWWLSHRKKSATRELKERKQFAAFMDGFDGIESEATAAIAEMQQGEFRRQRKWRQDRMDRLEFGARQWSEIRQTLLEHLATESDDATPTQQASAFSIHEPAATSTSSGEKQSIQVMRGLDITEGPCRMRKRIVLTNRPTLLQPGPPEALWKTTWNRRKCEDASTTHLRGKATRRFSDSDLRSQMALRNVQNARLDFGLEDETGETAAFPRSASRANQKSASRLPSASDDLLSESESAGDEDDTTSTVLDMGALNFEEDAIDEKLRPLLVPGDDVADIYDCLRIDGMDSSPGVFLICNAHAYIVDNYQVATETARTQAVRVVEAEPRSPAQMIRHLSSRFQTLNDCAGHDDLIGSGNDDALVQAHQYRYWSYEDITELHKRRHQLRHVALEIFAHNGQTFLITFASNQQRENVFHSLLAKCPHVRGAGIGMDRSALGGDLYSQLKKLLRQDMTERWIAREISNFEYLMHLNTLAGRSYNDLTQYPVFPWILADYSSESLDLDDASIYRDLSKPMGALHREQEFRARYESLAESADDSNPMHAKPFHYGTHYSSSGIVLHYLMRIDPFTQHSRILQGGKFDHADRLFSSVAGAWNSAAGLENAQSGTQDVRELIPEFFYLPTFLKNVNHHEFGMDQRGVTVDDVQLPPWAHGSPREFVRINRAALESEYVSEHLHHWIDLIFGFQQQGPDAVDACNVFYHLTYEGAVDLDTIEDPRMKRAIVDQINEFGQTPSQLFKTPHPTRARPSSSAQGASSLVQILSNSFGPFAGESIDAPTPNGDVSPLQLSAPSSARALVNSFVESSDIVSRMQTMLLATGVGVSSDAMLLITDHAAQLEHEAVREVVANPCVVAHRAFDLDAASSTHARGHNASSGRSVLSVGQIALASGAMTREERIVTVGQQCVLIPPRHHEYLAWGFQDRSLKVLTTGASEGSSGEPKIVSAFEVDFQISVARVTADGKIFIAGGACAPVLRLWHFGSKRTSSSTASNQRKRTFGVNLHTSGHSVRSMTPFATLSTPRHSRCITALAVSRAYSLVASGCAGGVTILWDLNRLRYVSTLPPVRDPAVCTEQHARRGIAAIEINNITGDIVVASGAGFAVYDVNGEVLVRHHPQRQHSAFPLARITSLVVNRSEACEWSKERAIVTGHSDGVMCVWGYSQAGYGDAHWVVALKSCFSTPKTQRNRASGPPARNALTAMYLSPDERKLYTGDASGRLSLWRPVAQSSSASSTPSSTRSLGATMP